MDIKDELKGKRDVLDKVLNLVDKLMKEIKEERTVKDINELIFCLLLLKQVSVNQKKKLERKKNPAKIYT